VLLAGKRQDKVELFDQAAETLVSSNGYLRQAGCRTVK
jgi:hypothetical protein